MQCDRGTFPARGCWPGCSHITSYFWQHLFPARPFTPSTIPFISQFVFAFWARSERPFVFHLKQHKPHLHSRRFSWNADQTAVFFAEGMFPMEVAGFTEKQDRKSFHGPVKATVCIHCYVMASGSECLSEKKQQLIFHLIKLNLKKRENICSNTFLEMWSSVHSHRCDSLTVSDCLLNWT